VKIAFICGSLELGKDGVGDYTQQLAKELTKNEIEVLLIAINDSFIKNTLLTSQKIDNKKIKILRISSHLSELDRVKKAKEQIHKFKPDWISLQFVPYSFHTKGLPFTFAKALKELGDFRWHIMFHELWIDKPEKWSQRLVSFFTKKNYQRTGIHYSTKSGSCVYCI